MVWRRISDRPIPLGDNQCQPVRLALRLATRLRPDPTCAGQLALTLSHDWAVQPQQPGLGRDGRCTWAPSPSRGDAHCGAGVASTGAGPRAGPSGASSRSGPCSADSKVWARGSSRTAARPTCHRAPGPAARGRLAGQSQAGGAQLAPEGPEGAEKTAPARQTVAERRFLPAAPP